MRTIPPHIHMTRIRRVALASLIAATPLAAQGPDATAQRIFRIGMDSSWAQKLSQTLFDSIGPRLTASPAHHAAGDWVVKMYKEWGIEAKKEQYGTWRGWKRGVSHIDLMRPRVRSLEGTMLAWSPGTNGKPVTAEAAGQ